MDDIDPRLSYILVLLAGAFVGGLVGRAMAPSTDLDLIITADKARSAQISACEKGFTDALEVYKNTSAKAIAEIKAAHEEEMAQLRKANQEDLAVMKLAIMGCKEIAH